MSLLPLWLPPVLWTGVIFWLSTDLWSAEHTGRVLIPLFAWLLPRATAVDLGHLHLLARKGAHLTEYAIVAVLWMRACRRGTSLGAGSAATVALAIAGACAILDETHQAFVPGRTASAGDVGIDSIGALAGLCVLSYGWRGIADRTATVLLWVATVGGVIVLAIDRFTATPSGAVRFTTPLAIAALIVRARWLRRPHTAADTERREPSRPGASRGPASPTSEVRKSG